MPLRDTSLVHEDDPDPEDHLVELLWSLDEELISGQAGGDYVPPALAGDLDPQAAQWLDASLETIELLACTGRASTIGTDSDEPTSSEPFANARGHNGASAGYNASENGVARGAMGHSSAVLANGLPSHLGRFEIVRELGRGGLGIVLLARDPVLKRDVALKIPRPEALFTSDLRRRFAREAQAAARLTHPNLVAVYEVGTAGAVAYIAAAYCEGPSLSDWISAHPAGMPTRWAAEIVAQLADGVAYANEQGVLHRDLKPSNVLLVPRHEDAPEDSSAQRAQDTDAVEAPAVTPRITDFGLARIEEHSSGDTRTGLVMGTPAYMAPEQAEGRREEIGPATDVYGLGTILYELLTGHAPFGGQSDADILRRVVSDEPPRPRRVVPAIPRDLEAICLKCLEKTSARRYATAGGLAADLRRFLGGEPTVARPMSPLERLVRWSRRKPLAAVTAFLLFTVAIVSIVAAVTINNAREAALAAATESQEMARLERASRQATTEALASERQSRSRAEAAEAQATLKAQTAEQVSQFLADLFASADPTGFDTLGFRAPDKAAAEMSVRELVDRGRQKIASELKNQPEIRGPLLDRLGGVYITLGLFGDAEQLLGEALGVLRASGEESTDLAAALEHWGLLLHFKARYEDSEAALRESLEINRRLLPSDDPRIARSMVRLAWLLQEFGSVWHVRHGRQSSRENKMTEEAEKLLRDALVIQRKSLGAAHREVAVTLTSLLLILGNDGSRRAEANLLMLQALAIYVQQPGGDALGRAVLEIQRGVMARLNSKLPRAEQHYRKALDQMTTFLGNDHVAVVAIRGELAGILASQGKMAEAEPIIRDAIAAGRKLAPLGHPQLFDAIEKVAKFSSSRGDYDEALTLRRELLPMCRHLWGEGSAEEVQTLCRIADDLSRRGNLSKARRTLEEVRALVARFLPDSESSLAKSARAKLNWSEALLVEAQGELAAAESLLRNALPEEKSCGTDLARVIHVQRPNDTEAEELLRAFLTSVWNPDEDFWAGTRLVLADVLIDQGNISEATQLAEGVWEIHRTIEMNARLGVGEADCVLGALRTAQGRFDEAESLLKGAYEKHCQLRNPQDHAALAAVRRLADLYKRWGKLEMAEKYDQLAQPLVGRDEDVAIPPPAS